jgi:exodeoxyribonuclease VII large subunit
MQEQLDIINDDGRKIYTVSELNKEIKTVLEGTYTAIWLEGEISNFKAYPSGHMYFSLKDDQAQINAVIFAGTNTAKFDLQNGQKVLVLGRISTYPKRGDYQILVWRVEPLGKGALQITFEQLKEKLEKEGLFDVRHKKQMPDFVQKIGIITSPEGAAIQDILAIINQNPAKINMLLYPVQVQGEQAKYDIVKAINYFNKNHPSLDVLLVGRGGGTLEDLWAFNEEIVARAIYESKIPIISCVGHEIDFTIADFVADLRAPTPSAAAEILVKSNLRIRQELENLSLNLDSSMRHSFSIYSEKLKHLASSRVLSSPKELIKMHFENVNQLMMQMENSIGSKITSSSISVKNISAKLGLLSPLNILSRGYSISRKYPQNSILHDAKDLKVNDTIKTELASGSFVSEIKEVLNG